MNRFDVERHLWPPCSIKINTFFPHQKLFTLAPFKYAAYSCATIYIKYQFSIMSADLFSCDQIDLRKHEIAPQTFIEIFC